MDRVLLYQEALAEVMHHAATLHPLGLTETLPLLQACGRVLALPLSADRDQPPFARSTRDGYAVRSSDLGQRETLRLLGSVRAGEQWQGPSLQAGQAIEIMTGAPVPAGADAILMVEFTEPTAERQVVPAPGRRLRPGENIVAAGAEAHRGAELVPAGRLLAIPDISVAASCGFSSLTVFPRPLVSIIATGDELVELDQPPEAWQIRNSNSYSLAALVSSEGGQAQRQPIARDTLPDLRTRLENSAAADLLLLSGGVSMGKYDLVEQALAEAGAEFLFTGALIQPGKPIVFGRLPRSAGGHTYFFGLPGNPISTEVCFRLFATPLLRALAGRSDREVRFAEARLAEGIAGGAKVTRFLPAHVESDWEQVSVRPVPWHGSGDLAANARANAFVVLPREVAEFHAGETVRVLLR